MENREMENPENAPMEFEHHTAVIPVDKNFETTLKKLVEVDGWIIVPHILPIAIYQLVRPIKGGDAMGAKLKMSVDDTKVGILRADGTHEAADGTITRPGDKS